MYWSTHVYVTTFRRSKCSVLEHGIAEYRDIMCRGDTQNNFQELRH